MKLSQLNAPSVLKYLSEKKENQQMAAEIQRVKNSTNTTQNKIGEKAGLSKAAISLHKSGDRTPLVGTIEKYKKKAGINYKI